jgi:hypothetical protein
MHSSWKPSRAALFAAVVLLAPAWTRGHAQPSTDALQPAGRNWFAQITAGSAGNRARAALASIDWEPSGITGIRAMGWWLQRDAGGDYFSARVFAVAMAADLRLVLVRGSITLTPSVGFGIAPWVKGTIRSTTYQTGGGTPTTNTQTQSGNIWLGGVALRVKHFVIERSVVEVVGVTGVGAQHTYTPLMIGLRY